VDLTDVTDDPEGPLAAMVADYYRSIDCRDLESALSCFAPDAVYRRPGYEVLVGIDAIVEFYCRERVISAGQHRIESIIENANEVAVRGSFCGASHTGIPLAVRFADFWRFSGLVVIERNTYFDAAAV
jgi:ketosteroid isomerase-like protein